MSRFDENIEELRGLDDESPNTLSEPEISTETQPLLQPKPIRSETASVETTHLVDVQNPSDEVSIANEDQSTPSTMPASLFFTLSTIYGGTAVALGAFGAHGLKRRISDPSRIANWSTAAQYQLIHSVALLATSIALPSRAQRVPGGLFLAGMTMFSGSLYLLVFDPQRFKWAGPITPLGGLCLIGGWIGLGVMGRRVIRLH